MEATIMEATASPYILFNNPLVKWSKPMNFLTANMDTKMEPYLFTLTGFNLLMESGTFKRI
jgi:hypothetical protein